MADGVSYQRLCADEDGGGVGCPGGGGYAEEDRLVSTIMSSMGKNKIGGFYQYRASKAALNAIMRSLAIDLGKRGILAIAVHPGWVRTDMGGRRRTSTRPPA
ncbi:MAG: SDR family NAD(P)-dependent oxidoreductase [Gammaproteobacteria bacterium]|nr:SDR family NAD(P)-dependent oxidoreductase [Gammaproteobacteria bacterium]